jgi:hypothetical protein
MNNEYSYGDKVIIKLSGDDEDHKGIVIKPKKLWVEINLYGVNFIADECNIVSIRRLEYE